MSRHIHADLIIEWAETGCDIQYLTFGDKWVTGDPKWNPKHTYRKKPQTLKYKRYLAIIATKKHVIQSFGEGQGSIEELQKSGHFQKWIDEDWQEVEI